MPTVNIVNDGNTGDSAWFTEPTLYIDVPEVCINEGTILGGHTPNDENYIFSNTDGDYLTLTWQDMPAAATTITQIDVHIRGKIDDTSTHATLELRLYHSSTTELTGNPQIVTAANFGGYSVLGETTKSWTGLTLTKTQANSLTIRIKLIA